MLTLLPRRSTRKAWIALAGASSAVLLTMPGPAGAQSCGRAVVVALPGVTWADVQRVRPPELLAAMRGGSSASVSVRVFSANSDYGSGFATLGAGTRLAADPQGLRTTASRGRGGSVRVLGLGAVRRGAERAGYDATPGALASALPGTPVAALGNAALGDASREFSAWVVLAAMTRAGIVRHSFTGGELLRQAPRAPFGVATDGARAARAVADALELRCGLTVATEGDLIRAEQAALRGADGTGSFDAALRAADGLVGAIRGRLDARVDTLLIVTPTGPAASGIAHLGIAIAEGPGFEPGGSLASASTRRRGTVTLPDVAPTVLDHYGDVTHPPMVGRPWFSVPGHHELAAAVRLDREAVFVDAATSGAVRVFIGFQILLYGVAVTLFLRRSRAGRFGPWLERAALAMVAWPLATYLVGIVDGHALGFAAWGAAIGGLDLALVVAVSAGARAPLTRLLLLNAATAALVIVDLVMGGRLQMNTVLGYSPIVGGRFSGIGNLGFAVLAASVICSAALVVQARRGARPAVVAMALLFAAVVVVDGAPGLGSDVGGTLALVPGLGLALVLLWGGRVDLKLMALFGAAAVVAVAGFLAFDLSRPPEARTHLARLYESVADRGGGALVDAMERKAAANLRLLMRSVWAIPVIPAAVALHCLVTRPRGRWARLRSAYPAATAGLVAGVVTAALGFAVNDSGIGIPSVMLIFLVPYALVLRLDEERTERS
jgi:hypothetical protein